MKFNENLRAFRKEKDFSQEYLAEKMNVSRQTISKWENGTAMPDLKRLTELAELFETSMDELLGTSSPAPRGEDISIEEIQSYAYNIAQSQIDAYKKKNKTAQTIMCFAIVMLTIALIITNISINNISNNLTNAINNNSSKIIYQNNDYEQTASDFTTAFVSNINKDDPRLAEVTFVYSPTTYVKGTTVSFVVKDMTSSLATDDEIIADLQANGKFVATKEINFSSFNTADIKIDDGSNVTTEKLELDWAVLYRDFKDIFIEYNFFQTGIYTVIEFLDTDYVVRWGNNEAMPSITEAYIEAKYNNTVLESQKLEIKSEGTTSFVKPSNLKSEIKNFDSEKLNVYVKLVDEYGNRYYIDCISTIEDNTSNDITIEFAKGGRLCTESYIDKTDN